MGNARAEVKAAAKKVIGANTEDGLARFLNELVDQGLVAPDRAVTDRAMTDQTGLGQTGLDRAGEA
jgi:hypothetical protein